jgi:hypothetical protein
LLSFEAQAREEGDIYHGFHDIVVETTEEDLAEVR